LISSTVTCDKSVRRGEQNFVCRPETFWPIEVRTRPESKSPARLTTLRCGYHAEDGRRCDCDV